MLTIAIVTDGGGMSLAQISMVEDRIMHRTMAMGVIALMLAVPLSVGCSSKPDKRGEQAAVRAEEAARRAEAAAGRTEAAAQRAETAAERAERIVSRQTKY
jgi:hypothetical protein